MPLLIIASTGSEICDTCTTLKESIRSLPDSNDNQLAARTYADQHLTETHPEFHNYEELREDGLKSGKDIIRQFVLDFTESVLLPRLQEQQGQIHFVTALKVDIFGVECSNDSETDIYGLFEDHWIQENGMQLYQ